MAMSSIVASRFRVAILTFKLSCAQLEQSFFQYLAEPHTPSNRLCHQRKLQLDALRCDLVSCLQCWEPTFHLEMSFHDTRHHLYDLYARCLRKCLSSVEEYLRSQLIANTSAVDAAIDIWVSIITQHIARTASSSSSSSSSPPPLLSSLPSSALAVQLPSKQHTTNPLTFSFSISIDNDHSYLDAFPFNPFQQLFSLLHSLSQSHIPFQRLFTVASFKSFLSSLNGYMTSDLLYIDLLSSCHNGVLTEQTLLHSHSLLSVQSNVPFPFSASTRYSKMYNKMCTQKFTSPKSVPVVASMESDQSKGRLALPTTTYVTDTTLALVECLYPPVVEMKEIPRIAWESSCMLAYHSWVFQVFVRSQHGPSVFMDTLCLLHSDISHVLSVLNSSLTPSSCLGSKGSDSHRAQHLPRTIWHNHLLSTCVTTKSNLENLLLKISERWRQEIENRISSILSNLNVKRLYKKKTLPNTASGFITNILMSIFNPAMDRLVVLESTTRLLFLSILISRLLSLLRSFLFETSARKIRFSYFGTIQLGMDISEIINWINARISLPASERSQLIKLTEFDYYKNTIELLLQPEPLSIGPNGTLLPLSSACMLFGVGRVNRRKGYHQQKLMSMPIQSELSVLKLRNRESTCSKI
eukprot:GILK01004717.1.p1 GENE.GILK01004717.1~~GILK01004717.1.p1  ORF type:complete len:638 (-),score=94.29 GILK01004717.1:95-2008(-)